MTYRRSNRLRDLPDSFAGAQVLTLLFTTGVLLVAARAGLLVHPTDRAGTRHRMAHIAIDWAAADVIDGRLTVAFTEKPPKDWTQRLQAVVERLARNGTGWGAIEIAKRELHIDDVQPGAEEDLRHFLDSALLQANADTGDDGDDPPASNRSERDQALTEAFRAFRDS